MSMPGVLLAAWLALLAAGAGAQQDSDAIVLIGHSSLPRLDGPTVQRLYTGRVVEINGESIVVVNAPPGSKARERFLTVVMKMDEESYTGYWTVRKHVGKGSPPRELRTAPEMMSFVQATPGAVGYVAASELRPGLNVVHRP